MKNILSTFILLFLIVFSISCEKDKNDDDTNNGNNETTSIDCEELTECSTECEELNKCSTYDQTLFNGVWQITVVTNEEGETSTPDIYNNELEIIQMTFTGLENGTATFVGNTPGNSFEGRFLIIDETKVRWLDFTMITQNTTTESPFGADFLSYVNTADNQSDETYIEYSYTLEDDIQKLSFGNFDELVFEKQ